MRTVRTETQFTLEEKPSAPCCSGGLFEKFRVSYTLQTAEPPYSVNSGPIKKHIENVSKWRKFPNYCLTFRFYFHYIVAKHVNPKDYSRFIFMHKYI